MTCDRAGSTLAGVSTHGVSAESPGWIGPFAWLAELTATTPGLVEAYLPGSGGIDARTREAIHVKVARADATRIVAWAHETWAEFIGPGVPDGALASLHGFVHASTQAVAPLDADTFEFEYPPAIVRSTRATIALARISTGLVGALEGLVPGSRHWGLRRAIPNAAAVTASIPLLPVLAGVGAVAGSMKVLLAVAPPVPEPVLPSDEDANLVAHMLAGSLSTFLGNVAVRLVLVWSPIVLSLGVRADGAAATLRIGRGRIEVANGISPDALVVVDGGIEPLLSLAADSILHQLVADDDASNRHG